MRIRLALVLGLCGFAVAQEISISAGSNQRNPLELQIQVTGMDDKQFESFFGEGPGHTGSAYVLFAVTHIDEPEVKAEDRTSEYIRPDQATRAGTGRIQILLLKPLRGDTQYLIVINGLGKKNRVVAKLDPKASVITSDPTRIAREVKVSAAIPLGNKQNDTVTVERKKAIVVGGNVVLTPQTIKARVARVDSDGLVLDLEKSLSSGTDSLSVKGLIDIYGNSVAADGKIDVAAAPTNESDAYVLAKFAANAAVHQAPIFTFTGNIAPLHPPSHAVYWGPVRVDPSTVIDVGLRSTKSANSIVVPAPFGRTLILGLPTLDKSVAQFKKINPTAMQFTFGPRLETDRDFRRLNSLGEVRWDLYLPALSHDMTGTKAQASAGQPQYRDFLELPIRGYAFAPYVQLDAGAHVNEETVTNTKTKQSVVVPSHSIARAYFGLKGTIQYWLASVDLDMSYVDMLRTETIGYTTATQALLRRAEGWQPHAKLGFSIFLSQAKHVAFNITAENGRSAPNFEYLNKVDVGFKVVY